MKQIHFDGDAIRHIQSATTFTVFRNGPKWHEQVREGQVIEIVSNETNEAIGQAVVAFATLGTWDEVYIHADDEVSWQNLSADEARDQVKNDLSKRDPDFDEELTLLSVLYLMRVA